MNNQSIDLLLIPFRDSSFDLANEATWAHQTDEQVNRLSPSDRLQFWQQLATLFEAQERTKGHLHKGHIYWRLGLEVLLAGDLHASLTWFEKSVSEDQLRGDKISSSQGLTAILAPLLHCKGIDELYNGLTPIEKTEFARNVIIANDQIASNSVAQIKDEYFTFVSDDTLREIVYSTYKEVFVAVTGVRQETFYSCAFALGSIIEAMIDDLFSRHDYEVWKRFVDLPAVKNDPDAKELLTQKPQNGWMLGKKLTALRLMARYGIEPISKVAILQIHVFHQYRNLIHPDRRRRSRYSCHHFVAAALFSFVSHIASHWWQSNVDKRLAKDHGQLPKTQQLMFTK